MSQGQAKSPTFLLKEMQAKRLDPKDLTPHQRKVLVRYFMEEQPGVTEVQIASILGTSRSVVTRYKKKIINQDGWIVDQVDYREYTARLMNKYGILITKMEQNARALEENTNPKRFQAAIVWEKIGYMLKTMTDQLMELGVLKRAPIEFKGQMTLLELLNRARELHVKRLSTGEAATKTEAPTAEKILDRTTSRELGVSQV